jgi:hypothetical protein
MLATMMVMLALNGIVLFVMLLVLLLPVLAFLLVEFLQALVVMLQVQMYLKSAHTKKKDLMLVVTWSGMLVLTMDSHTQVMEMLENIVQTGTNVEEMVLKKLTNHTHCSLFESE